MTFPQCGIMRNIHAEKPSLLKSDFSARNYLYRRRIKSEPPRVGVAFDKPGIRALTCAGAGNEGEDAMWCRCGQVWLAPPTSNTGSPVDRLTDFTVGAAQGQDVKWEKHSVDKCDGHWFIEVRR